MARGPTAMVCDEGGADGGVCGITAGIFPWTCPKMLDFAVCNRYHNRIFLDAWRAYLFHARIGRVHGV